MGMFQGSDHYAVLARFRIRYKINGSMVEKEVRKKEVECLLLEGWIERR